LPVRVFLFHIGDRRKGQAGMKTFLIGVSLIASAGAAAYWIGKQMPDEAVMAFVGVMCGIVASIPLSIGLLVLLTRDRSAYVTGAIHEDAPAPQTPERAPSHWIVITPDAPRLGPGAPPLRSAENSANRAAIVPQGDN